MLSLLFIRRPKLATVIAIALFLVGVICAFRLPISEYPPVAPPQVVVAAYYAGASAEEIANTVAAPIEAEINTVEDVVYYDSKSDNSGNYTLVVTFKPDANEDMALVNVNNAVKLAEPKLPTEVKATGVVVLKQSSDVLCAVVVHSSNPAHSLIDVSTFADIRIKDAVSRIDGVATARLYGEMKRSMRCWLKPEKMRAMGISIAEVKAAIASQNLQAAAGAVGTDRAGEMMQYKILADGRLKTVEEFENIVVRSSLDASRLVRMRDIARVELGAEKYATSCRFNGENAVMMVVNKLSKGNALDVFKQIMKVMKDVEKTMPEGMEWDIAYDSTTFVRASMREIVTTLLETFLLVVLITWIFLQSVRATLIPAVAIPVSLVGTFFFLQLFGMSVNTLSMFALILVIGSVVDDAICITESCMVKLQSGLGRFEAAVGTMKEISGALIATTLVVVAVYAPIAFVRGMVGVIYLQFSVTMCVALCLSTFCALTLSCAMAAFVMEKPSKSKGLFRWFNALFDRLCDGAVAVCRVMIRFMPITIFAFVAFGLGAVWLFRSIPPSFLEDEDKGALFVEVTLPPGAVLARTEAVSRDVAARILKFEEVESVTEVHGAAITAGTGENMACMVVKLKDWKMRRGEAHTVGAVQARIMTELADVADASIVAFSPPPIMGLGYAGGVTFLLQGVAGQSAAEIAQAARQLTYRVMNTGKALYAYSTFEASTPLVKFVLDRQMAEMMGVRVADVFAALQGQLGSYYVNDFNLDSKNYQVNIQADVKSRATANQLNMISVSGAKGVQVPIFSIGSFHWTVGPRQIERFNMFPAASFQAMAASGVSSGELMREIERAADGLGPGWQIAYTDVSYQERQNEGEIVWMLFFSIVMAYLFLVGKYESWTVPLPVILCVLVALFGGLLGVRISGIPMNIYCQLGILMLIGVTAKSTILIAEYAMQKEQAGMPLVEAAVGGMRQRFRSVQMTALSFVIGVLPLLTAAGAGAGSRRSVGVTTFWGMLVASAVGMLFVPPLYVFFRRLALCVGGRKRPRSSENMI